MLRVSSIEHVSCRALSSTVSKMWHRSRGKLEAGYNYVAYDTRVDYLEMKQRFDQLHLETCGVERTLLLNVIQLNVKAYHKLICVKLCS